jgi:aldehyde:ferredoxin oxidoreductase
MASKHLKAIAVRGTRKLPLADPGPIQRTAKWVSETMEDNHYTYHHLGTGAGIVSKHLEGHLVVRNFRDGQWGVQEVEALDARAIAEQYREKMDGCFACSVRCKKRVRDEALGLEPRYGGPEYETLGAIGTNLTVSELPLVLRINQRLNQVGLDSVSFGSTVAWAMECYERGLLTDSETGGIPLRWGDGDTVLRLVDMVACREGPLGDLLAEGAASAAQRLGRGSAQYVVHIKGLEMAMHDPRAMPDMLNSYPIAPTGGDHTGASRHRTSLRNTAGLCIFLGYDEPRVVDLVRGATGWDVDEQELRAVVCRGLSLARLFNLREGLTAAEDRLPDRMHEPLLKGPLSDRRLPREEVARVVRDYYIQQGWHAESGIPLQSTLVALGIGEYAIHTRGVSLPCGGAPVLPPAVLEAEQQAAHQE